MTQAVARMKLISGTGSYDTTLGTTIDENGNAAPSVRDSETNWDETELPAISVFDGDVVNPNLEADKQPSLIVVQHLLFQGVVKLGTDAAAVRKLIKDIYTAIRVDTQWSESGTPLVMQTRMVKHAIQRNKDSFEVEGCEVEVELQYFIQKFTS